MSTNEWIARALADSTVFVGTLLASENPVVAYEAAQAADKAVTTIADNAGTISDWFNGREAENALRAEEARVAQQLYNAEVRHAAERASGAAHFQHGISLKDVESITYARGGHPVDQFGWQPTPLAPFVHRYIGVEEINKKSGRK